MFRMFVMLGLVSAAGSAVGGGAKPPIKLKGPDLVCSIKVSTDSAGTHPVAENSHQYDVWVRFVVTNRGGTGTAKSFITPMAVESTDHADVQHSAMPWLKLGPYASKKFPAVHVAPKANTTYVARAQVDWPGFSGGTGAVKETNEQNNTCSFRFQGPSLR